MRVLGAAYWNMMLEQGQPSPVNISLNMLNERYVVTNDNKTCRSYSIKYLTNKITKIKIGLRRVGGILSGPLTYVGLGGFCSSKSLLSAQKSEY
jgi:hypothetical protein